MSNGVATSTQWAEGGTKVPQDHPAFARVEIVDAQEGLVQCVPPRKKLAIVGFATSTRDQVPVDDPTWLIAGLNQLYRYLKRYDIWFEIHAREIFLADQVPGTDYLAWLRESPVPVFMTEPGPDIPRAVRFPIEAAVRLLGRDYFESSIAFMVAWGLLAGFEEIGIWGVDLVVGGEYAYQRPNLEYVLGIAHALGVKLTIPQDSAVLRTGLTRYGTPWPKFGPFSETFFVNVMKKGNERREALITELNNTDGALSAYRNMLDALQVYQRGGVIRIPGLTS